MCVPRTRDGFGPREKEEGIVLKKKD